MRKFKQYAVLLASGILLSSVAFAQDAPAGGGEGATKYSKRNQAQQESYEKGEYLFPAKPRDNYSIGIKGGLSAVSGDVTMQPGWDAGITLRKAIGHVFSLRADANVGVMRGLNYQASQGYYKHDGYNNPWAANYRTLEGGNPVPVYYNFRNSFFDLGVQGIVNLNNINFYKRDVKWNLYALGGVGVMGYRVTTDALNGNNPYTSAQFATAYGLTQGLQNDVIFAFGKERAAVRDELQSVFDGTYESLGEQSTDARGVNIGKDDANAKKYYQINPLISAGMGVRYKINRRIDVELEHRISWTGDDLLDGSRWQEWGGFGTTSMTRDADNYSLTTVGIQFRLGKGEEAAWWSNPMETMYKKAQDQQQMVDRMQDDSDGDGVPDLFDKDPDTPQGVGVDPSGRPLDADGDGVADNNDSEPFSPKGAKVDAQGRALDSDGDGVPDVFDKQNQKPQAGEFVDARGMIIIVPKAEAAAPVIVSSGGGACMLPMIHFDLDKDAIKPEFFPELYYIAQVMRNDASVRVRAIGNTDVRNSDAYNENLSKRRVQNAVDFIVNTYGIDRARFDVSFDGEKKNIVANLPQTQRIQA